LFIAFDVDRFGRKKPLLLGVALMSMLLWIVGAIFNTHPPIVGATTPSGSSIAMALMVYFFVIPYCFSVGPLPWVICAESKRSPSHRACSADRLLRSRQQPNSSLRPHDRCCDSMALGICRLLRHTNHGSQASSRRHCESIRIRVSMYTAYTLHSQFFFFAANNMISFALAFFLPETKGLSLESMVCLTLQHLLTPPISYRRSSSVRLR